MALLPCPAAALLPRCDLEWCAITSERMKASQACQWQGALPDTSNRGGSNSSVSGRRAVVSNLTSRQASSLGLAAGSGLSSDSSQCLTRAVQQHTVCMTGLVQPIAVATAAAGWELQAPKLGSRLPHWQQHQCIRQALWQWHSQHQQHQPNEQCKHGLRTLQCRCSGSRRRRLGQACQLSDSWPQQGECHSLC